MNTGTFSGLLAGTALSALVLGVASVMTFEDARAPDATEVAVPAGSEFRQSREDTQASLPASDDTPDAASKPRIEAPEPDNLASLEDGATAPSEQPDAAAPSAGLIAPEAPDDALDLNLDIEEPVLPSPQALAPQTPESEGQLSISTEPAQPLQPEIEADSAFEDEEQAVVSPQPAEDSATVADTPTDAAPQVQTEIEAPVVVPESEAAQPPEPDTIAEVAPAPDSESDEAPDVQVDAEPEPQPEPKDAPELALQTQPQPSGTIGNLAEGVTVGRLPSVGEAEAEPEATAESGSDVPQTRLERYSVEFENPDGKPLMSFVLLDQGDSPISFEALADFPYPISYAIDVTSPGATQEMTRYREAGLEVLAMVDLPDGASATDTEVAMQTYLAALPETVAVMEGVATGLQSSREATEQLIPILQESGHGLVLFSNGFDTAQKLIAREGVPALSVFRDIDSNGQTATVIRRFLDQAAFRAGQEEAGVIIVGRLRAETVSALLLWGLQDRANSVAIAPISALLKAQVEP